jgi:hypothetical protein
LIAIPVGYFLGHQIAFVLLGEPMRLVGHQHISLIPILFTVLVGGMGLHHFATREQLAKEAPARPRRSAWRSNPSCGCCARSSNRTCSSTPWPTCVRLVREDVDRAESMIDQLIVYLRSALAASQTESVALSREFAQLRAYLDIMALRMGPRLTWRLDLPAALEPPEVPPMLLQPLVENAIKHGLEPKVGAGSIEVVARATPRASRSASTTAAWACRPTSEATAESAAPATPATACSTCATACRRVYGPRRPAQASNAGIPTGVQRRGVHPDLTRADLSRRPA